jgi:hypothetical protein
MHFSKTYEYVSFCSLLSSLTHLLHSGRVMPTLSFALFTLAVSNFLPRRYYPKTSEYVTFMGNRNFDEMLYFAKHTPLKPKATILPRPYAPMIMLEKAEALMTTLE